MRYRRAWLRVATASLVAGSLFGLTAAAAAEGACTPGKTKKIAFMLKQQTAFRYLNADVPFFKKTAEAAGYEVHRPVGRERCAEPDRPGRERHHPGRRRDRHPAGRFQRRRRHRRDGGQGGHPARLL